MAKPYDRLFKSFAEDDPRGLLHLFGSLPLDTAAEVEALGREQNLPTLAVDHVYRVKTADREWLVHFEVQTRYKSDVPQRLAWYGVSLGLGFRLPLEIVLVLLVEKQAPAATPPSHRIDLGGLHVEVEFRTVRLWEIDPRPVLEAHRPSLLPWVTLMRRSPEALEQAARQITARRDLKAAAEFVVLGGLRYDKNDLTEMLGRIGAMLTEEMLEESSYYQMIIETGRLKEARKVLHRLLALRFPALAEHPDLGRITQLDRLEDLLEAVVTAQDENAAGAAIRQALSV